MSHKSSPSAPLSSLQRRRLLQSLGALGMAGLPGLAAAQTPPTAKVNTTKLAITDTEVTVGQLHSATGTMAISETGSIQAEQLAIDQINAMGGILGRKIKVIKEDGASDWPTFAEKSKKLLVNDHVACVFGCWTSASRKAVLPIFEKENGLLYYPTFFFFNDTATNEIYTVNAYFNSTSNLTDGHTVTLSVDGDTDVTVGTSTSHFGATTAVSNGSGAAIGVVATQLVFKTQPAGSVSGAALTTQPAVAATDAFGNTDIDFTGNVTVTEASPGALSGTNNQAAVGGTATFSNLAYTATADQESFTLTASSAGLTDGAANAVTSDVVATKLLFTTQPAPTSLTSGSATSFATVPVVKAVNAGDVVDTGYSTAVVLGVTDPADSIVDGTVNNLSGTGDTDGSGVTVTLSPASGVATFTGLGIQYTNGGASDTIALHATSGGLTAANSASLTVVLPLPTLSSATYDAATGVLAVTAANMTGGDTISVSKLTLTGEGGIPYALTSADVTASSATSFSVTLNSTDKEAVNRILNKNGTASTGATAYNLAAADDWDANSTSGDSSDPSNGVTVSNVAQPTITSATYDAATGVLAVTGTGLLSAAGSANDIVATKFSLFGQGAGAYTLTDTANVDIDSSTAFTMSLSATDQAGVNAVLDKNGTASQDNTPYNLIAAEDWAAGADPSVNVADTSGNGITVSNATDNDGVPNAVEDGVANPSGGGSGDGNGDGIQDSLQGHVASLPAAVGGAVVTLATRDASVPLAGVTALPAPNDPPPGVSFPFGTSIPVALRPSSAALASSVSMCISSA